MTDTLWTAGELAEATGGTPTGTWAAVRGLSIDTRELSAGELFVALKGDSRDGHEFVPAALGAGAVAMVSTIDNLPAGAPLLRVDDTLRALERLAVAARARIAGKVIAVTGSVGKTSTKEMLRTALAGQGRVHAAVRSFNNHWGVPLTLARMPRDTDFAVIEIGMNHAGEITPLSRMARPHIAMITTVEAVHLEAFDSVEQIADAKAEIFAGLEPGGIAVLNRDNPYFDRLQRAAGAATTCAFGRTAEHARLIDARIVNGRTAVRCRIGDDEIAFELGAPGLHFAMNAAGVLAVVDAAGADPGAAMRALADWMPPGGRGSRIRVPVGGGELDLIDESYNANPVSMRAALAVLSAAEVGGRRIAMLGDMLELGAAEMDLHAGLADASEMAGVDLVHTCGPRMRALHDALPESRRGQWAESSAELARLVPQLLDAGDAVMVKGSLGARMAIVVGAIRALGAPANKD